MAESIRFIWKSRNISVSPQQYTIPLLGGFGDSYGHDFKDRKEGLTLALKSFLINNGNQTYRALDLLCLIGFAGIMSSEEYRSFAAQLLEKKEDQRGATHEQLRGLLEKVEQFSLTQQVRALRGEATIKCNPSDVALFLKQLDAACPGLPSAPARVRGGSLPGEAPAPTAGPGPGRDVLLPGD